MALEPAKTNEVGNCSSPPPVNLHEHSSLITPEKLDGTNYEEWKLNATNKIKGRRRWGFITGTKAAPKDENSAEYETWDEENCLVKSWLLDAMTRDVRSIFLRLNTAKEIWDGLKQTYSVGQDASKAYQLHCEVLSVRQDEGSVTLYFGKLQKLWQDIDAIEPCTMECTNDIARYTTIVNSHRLYVFLAGLDSHLDGARGRILALSPLPNLQAAYAMVCQEANRQDAMLGASNSQASGAVMVSRQSFNKFNSKKSAARKCTHCNGENHVVETCFKLHGYPEWHPRGKKVASVSTVEEQVPKAHSVTTSGLTARSGPPYQGEDWQW